MQTNKRVKEKFYIDKIWHYEFIFCLSVDNVRRISIKFRFLDIN